MGLWQYLRGVHVHVCVHCAWRCGAHHAMKFVKVYMYMDMYMDMDMSMYM